jgi:hypothetical protein
VRRVFNELARKCDRSLDGRVTVRKSARDNDLGETIRPDQTANAFPIPVGRYRWLNQLDYDAFMLGLDHDDWFISRFV